VEAGWLPARWSALQSLDLGPIDHGNVYTFTSVGAGLCSLSLAGFRRAIKDVHQAGLERVFCAYDEQAIMPDQPLQNLGAVAQLIR